MTAEGTRTSAPRTRAVLPQPGRCAVMGILNVTPDSFSDGGLFEAVSDATAHGLRLAAESADIVDVGGESTHPDADRVPEEEELRRMLPVVRELAAIGVTVSVDTVRARVAEAAIAAGATVVNDVSGGLADPAMADVVVETGVTYVAMHWRAHSKEMVRHATYDDVVAEVTGELAARLRALVDAGVVPDQVVLDPGLGFAKTAEHNWALLAGLDTLRSLGRPVLWVPRASLSLAGSSPAGASRRDRGTVTPRPSPSPPSRPPAGSTACGCTTCGQPWTRCTSPERGAPRKSPRTADDHGGPTRALTLPRATRTLAVPRGGSYHRLTMPATSRQRHRAGNLPAELTSFVGRRSETTEIKRLLRESRLVTLTGMGGTGKTRLSLHVADEFQRAFPDGVWLVELAALDDGALLPQTVAQTLGLHDRSVRWPTSALAESLADKHMLLVMDNCEHLRDGCAILTEALLRAAPGLRVLATSRQPLGLTGEHIFRVPTLSLPDAGRLPRLESLNQYEAVNLFVDRARAVQPDFSLTEGNAGSVISVCQRLDGLPLAIELTAVRLRALSIREVAERIEDRFGLLTAGSPGALPRHQTLRALIDWSSDLCTDEERTLWARLSVFSGGFTLVAAEAVGGDEETEPSTLLDALSGLVDKSLVIAEERHGHVRYRMLDTIRAYGRDRLRHFGLESEVGDRHRAYFVELVEEACRRWFGPDQENVLSATLVEHGNIRAALDFMLREPRSTPSGVKMAGALWFLWLATGLTSEGRRWLERLLDADSTPGAARARALWVCAYLCVIQSDIPAAEALIEECRALAETIADPESMAWVEQLSGMVAMSRGQLREAQVHLEQGLARHQGHGNSTGVLDATFYLAAVCALHGRANQSGQLCEEALKLCDAHGERWLKSYLLWDVGLAAWQLGDSKRAAAAGREALELAKVFNEQWAIAFCIEILAWTAHAGLEHKRAAQLLGCADAIWRRIGAPLFGIRHLIRQHDQCVEGVRRKLGEDAYDAEFRTGTCLGSDQAVRYSLGERGTRARTRTGSVAAGVLTPRELEVAGLVAEGLSNKAIAAKLVIAQRTAEAHVEHILEKLGFSSRSQIAAWVAEERAAAPAAHDADGVRPP
jgi:dihydropteroate synthase